MARLCAPGSPVRPHLTVIGAGDGCEQLVTELTRHGVRDRVTLTGWVAADRVPELLAGADICVDPAPATYVNDRSTMTKIAEYLALGSPVVAYDLRETRETVQTAAVLVEPGQVDAFAAAIIELALDPERRAALSRQARERARQISWKHSERALLGVYAASAPGA
jgi:glycosyltransferase involved in cell wall biosynthesis